MTSRSQKAAALRVLTDTLRSRGGPQCATAKLPVQSQHGEVLEWKDYVRGKDLAKWLREKQEVLDEHTKPQGPGRTRDDQIADLVMRLVEAKLLLPADRKFKKPKPGKKKLVKFPRTLEPAAAEWSEDLFYAISYDEPWSWRLYVGAAAVVLGVIGMTLFPLAPYPVRLAVLYVLSGLLALMLGTMMLRYVLWFLVWLPTGAHFWLLPNMMSEELPITELFRPVISYDAAKPGDKSSSPWLRAAAALLLSLSCYGLYSVGPDAATVKGNLQDARDSVLSYLDLMGPMKQGITNGTNTTGIELNTTKPDGSSSSSTGSSGGGGSAEQQQQQQESRAGQGDAPAAAKEQAQQEGGDHEEWDDTSLESDDAAAAAAAEQQVDVNEEWDPTKLSSDEPEQEL